MESLKTISMFSKMSLCENALPYAFRNTRWEILCGQLSVAWECVAKFNHTLLVMGSFSFFWAVGVEISTWYLILCEGKQLDSWSKLLYCRSRLKLAHFWDLNAGLCLKFKLTVLFKQKLNCKPVLCNKTPSLLVLKCRSLFKIEMHSII